MPWLAAAAAIASILSAGYGVNESNKAKKKAAKEEKKLNAELQTRPQYKKSENVEDMKRDAQSRLGNLSPAVLAGYEQAQQQAANASGDAQRFAGSGAEALSASGNAQKRLYGVLPALAASQDEYQQRALGNYYGALQAASGEDQAAYADQVSGYGDRVNMSLGRMAAFNNDKALGKQMAMAGLMSAMGSAGEYANSRAPRAAAPQTPVNPAYAPFGMRQNVPTVSGHAPGAGSPLTMNTASQSAFSYQDPFAVQSYQRPAVAMGYPKQYGMQPYASPAVDWRRNAYAQMPTGYRPFGSYATP